MKRLTAILLVSGVLLAVIWALVGPLPAAERTSGGGPDSAANGYNWIGSDGLSLLGYR